MEGNRGPQRKSTQTWREHINATQIGPWLFPHQHYKETALDETMLFKNLLYSGKKWGKVLGHELEQNVATFREKVCTEISSEGNLL